MQGKCAVCHAVRGTPVLGGVAPDLTHLASRRTIAAATLPNSRGHLAGWIANPQSLKPGSHMPTIDLGAEELQAVVHYLETLR
jgi:cytochrome c oxidase subunit 2